MIRAANLNLGDLPFLAGKPSGPPSNVSIDTFESYTLGAYLGSLNAGVNWAAGYVDRTNFLGVLAEDTFEEYTPGADLNGLGGSQWAAAFVDRVNYLAVRAYDSMVGYANGQSIGGLNGGNLLWTSAYTIFSPSTDFATSTFTIPFTVTLSNSLIASPTFYYTTDGSTPTTSSAVYAGSISVSGAMTLSVLTVAIGFETRIDVVTYPYSSYTTDWLTRVNTNGATQPAWKTISAVDVLAKAMVTAGIDTAMKAVLLMVPDSLTAALTPFMKAAGNDPWMNHNFVAGDLSLKGLTPGSSKYLDSGIVPSVVWADNTTGGLTVYAASGVNETSYDLAAADAAYTNVTALYVDWNDGHSYLDLQGYSAGRISAANSAWAGFASGNRTSASAEAYYKASSSVAFGTIASQSGAGGTRAAYSLYEFALNQNGSVNLTYLSATRPHSFAAIHNGLTAPQAQAFYSAVQAFRVALGGGYV